MSVAVPYRVHADRYPCPGKTLAGKPLARYAGHTPRVRCPYVLAIHDFLSAHSCDLRRSRLPVPSLHRFEWPKVPCIFHFYFLCNPELLQAKDHMVFGRIYLSRYTLGFPRSSMVYVSTVPAPGKTFPAQVILCLLLKHTSPGLCCLGDTTFPSVMKGQVLSTSKVASSCLFVHRHARLSSRAM